MHPPSIDHGLASGIWGIGLGIFLYFGLLAVDVDKGTALVLAAVSGAAIFLLVRLRGGDQT